MAADFLTAVTALFTALGLSTTDVKHGPLTDEMDDETALVDYLGAPPLLTYCGPSTRLPRFTVFVRRATRNLAAARSEEIYVALTSVARITAGSILFHEIVPISEPAWGEEDANGLTIQTASYEAAVGA